MSDEFENLEDMKKANELQVDLAATEPSTEIEGKPGPTIDVSSNRYECRNCGYIYDPAEGVKKYGIASGTAFLDLDHDRFRCPVCRLGFDAFKDIGPRSTPSGFDENLNYGFGINNLSAGQKNVLIFGGLAFAVACFLSLYSLH